MLSIHKLFGLSAKWTELKKSRPSTIRYTILFWILRIVFGLIFVASIIVFWTTYSRELWLPLLKDELEVEVYEVMDKLLIVLRVLCSFIFIVSGLITWLTARSLRRNEYIDDLEELVEEYYELSVKEYNSNPNNQSIR